MSACAPSRSFLCALALFAFLAVASAARAQDAVLLSEDFNSYPPGSGLVKDLHWTSGAEKDDYFLAAGGAGGEKDIYLKGSTSIPVEKGASANPWIQKKFDATPDPMGGRYVIFEADLRGGPGPTPDALTQNCEIIFVDRTGGHPGSLAKWVRAYLDGLPAWTLGMSKDIALAKEPAETLKSGEKALEWIHSLVVVDCAEFTVQGMVKSSAQEAFSKRYAIKPQYNFADILAVVVRQDIRYVKFGLDIDNILVRQSGENPIPQARRGAVVGAPEETPGADASALPAGPAPKWIEPSNEIVTPHVPWSKPSAGAPLRVLFITYRHALREVVEFSERFDFEQDVFATESRTDFALPPLRERGLLAGTSPAEQVVRLRAKLAKDYDVIAIGNIKWDILPDWARSAIIDKVRAGTGLVAYVRPGSYPDLVPLVADKVADPREALDAFPFAGLPAFRTFATFENFCRNALCLARFGKGRVALLLGRAPEGASSALQESRGLGEGIRVPNRQMLTCEIVDPFPNFHPIEYDYYLALAGQLLRWASGADRPVRILQPPISSLVVSRDNAPSVPIFLRADSPRTVTLALAVRERDTGDVVAQDTKQTALEKGDNSVPFQAPSLPAGTYFLDVWAKQGDKVLGFGSLLLDVRSNARIETLRLAGLTFSQDEPVRGTLVLKDAPPQAKVELTRRDNYGRCVAKLLLDAPPASEELPFELSSTTIPLSPLGTVQARLLSGSQALDVKRAAYTLWDLFPSRDDVRAVMAEHYEEDSYLEIALARTIGELGFDSLMTAGGLHVYTSDDLKGGPWERWVRPPRLVDPKNVHTGASLLGNVRDLMSLYNSVDGQYDWYIEPRGRAVEGPRGPVRRPCLSNPVYVKKYRDFYAGEARRLRPFAIGEYNLGDESTFVGSDDDVCFSDTCVRDFQEFLREQYKSVADLNAEYGSNFAGFDEVVPVPFDEAKKSGKIPMWIDHRRHMETLWAGYYRNALDAVSAAVPGARVGYEGSDDAGHIRADRIGGADDYALLARSMTMNGTYYFPLQLDCVRDFSAPGTMIGGGWFGGYSALWRAGLDPAHHCWWIYNTLLRGANSFWVYQGSLARQGDGYFSALASDFSPHDYFRPTIEEIKFIKQGFGKLLMHSKRPDDGVAVLYSPSSMLMTAFEDNLPHRWDSPAAASFLFTEALFQYRMIDPSELAGGVLRSGNFRALYLPYCQALSPAEVDEVLAFAKSGGLVLADLRPGVADAHGKPYASSPLDALFGVKQVCSAARPQKIEIKITSAFAGLPGELPPAASDASLALAGATAHASAGDAPRPRREPLRPRDGRPPQLRPLRLHGRQSRLRPHLRGQRKGRHLPPPRPGRPRPRRFEARRAVGEGSPGYARLPLRCGRPRDPGRPVGRRRLPPGRRLVQRESRRRRRRQRSEVRRQARIPPMRLRHPKGRIPRRARPRGTLDEAGSESPPRRPPIPRLLRLHRRRFKNSASIGLARESAGEARTPSLPSRNARSRREARPPLLPEPLSSPRRLRNRPSLRVERPERSVDRVRPRHRHRRVRAADRHTCSVIRLVRGGRRRSHIAGLGKRFHHLPLLIAEPRGHPHAHADKVITHRPRARRNALTLEPQRRSRLRPRGHPRRHRPLHRFNVDIASQHRLGDGDLRVRVDVQPLPLETLGRLHAHQNVKIPGRTSSFSPFAQTAHADLRPVVDPLRDLDLHPLALADFRRAGAHGTGLVEDLPPSQASRADARERESALVFLVGPRPMTGRAVLRMRPARRSRPVAG
ncbi:MAG: beta-galactosidase [Planctomycetota bacterium]